MLLFLYIFIPVITSKKFSIEVNKGHDPVIVETYSYSSAEAGKDYLDLGEEAGEAKHQTNLKERNSSVKNKEEKKKTVHINMNKTDKKPKTNKSKPFPPKAGGDIQKFNLAQPVESAPTVGLKQLSENRPGRTTILVLAFLMESHQKLI